MRNRTAVYAGSFDILTFGHLQVISDAAELFDKLYVAIGVNPDKHCLFTLSERKEMLSACVLDDLQKYRTNCVLTIDIFENMYLVDYCRRVDADWYVRGIRHEDDYKFERAFVGVNRRMNSAPHPVWLPAAIDHEHVASSIVKMLIGPKGWQEAIRSYVPLPVYKKLLEKFGGK